MSSQCPSLKEHEQERVYYKEDYANEELKEIVMPDPEQTTKNAPDLLLRRSGSVIFPT